MVGVKLVPDRAWHAGVTTCKPSGCCSNLHDAKVAVLTLARLSEKGNYDAARHVRRYLEAGLAEQRSAKKQQRR